MTEGLHKTLLVTRLKPQHEDMPRKNIMVDQSEYEYPPF